MLMKIAGLVLVAGVVAPPAAQSVASRLVGTWSADKASLLELALEGRPSDAATRERARQEVEEAEIVLEVTTDRLTWKATGETDKTQTYSIAKTEPARLVLDAVETFDAWGGKGLEVHETLAVQFVDADTVTIKRGETPLALTMRRRK